MDTNDIIPFVSTEQYSTSISVVTDVNFSLQPNEAETICHSSPCVDLLLFSKYCTYVNLGTNIPYFQTDLTGKVSSIVSLPLPTRVA